MNIFFVVVVLIVWFSVINVVCIEIYVMIGLGLVFVFFIVFIGNYGKRNDFGEF